MSSSTTDLTQMKSFRYVTDFVLEKYLKVWSDYELSERIFGQKLFPRGLKSGQFWENTFVASNNSFVLLVLTGLGPK